MAVAEKVILLLLIYVHAVHSSTLLELSLFNGSNCASKAADNNVWNPSPSEAGTDGNNCIQSLPLVASSVEILALDSGCTVTLYSDQYCSDDATPTKVNQCFGVGGSTILSLSVDGCDVPFFASGNASATSTQSLFSTDSATSVVSSNVATSAVTSTAAASAHSGLSTGAKAGVGVGVAVGALLFIAGAIMLWFARRRSRAKGADAFQELAASREISEKTTAPDNGPPTQELPSPDPAVELETAKDRQELPTEYQQAGSKRISPGLQELQGSEPYNNRR